MRVRIQVDGYPFEITTRDPELLARWLAEVWTGIEWNPATYVQVQVYPVAVMGGGPVPAADWIADSRIITRHTPIKSPQEFVDALQTQINDLKELA